MYDWNKNTELLMNKQKLFIFYHVSSLHMRKMMITISYCQYIFTTATVD